MLGTQEKVCHGLVSLDYMVMPFEIAISNKKQINQ